MVEREVRNLEDFKAAKQFNKFASHLVARGLSATQLRSANTRAIEANVKTKFNKIIAAWVIKGQSPEEPS